MIVLPNITESLRTIRNAFTNGELQMCRPATTSKCTYQGPCAVGVLMQPAERIKADEKGCNIFSLVESKEVQTDNIAIMGQLQHKHDYAVTCHHYAYLNAVAAFDIYLTELEERYT